MINPQHLIHSARLFVIDLIKNFREYQKRHILFRECLLDTVNMFTRLASLHFKDNIPYFLTQKNMKLLLKRTLLSPLEPAQQ